MENVSRRWIIILFSSVVGTIVGWAMLHYQSASVFANILLFPGFVLSVPIYVFGGGVHGNGADFWAYSVVPLNAVGYGLIAWGIYQMLYK